MLKSEPFMIISDLSFEYLSSKRLKVYNKKNRKAVFQLRDNYMPILIYSDLSEKDTYKAMLLTERNNEEIVKGYNGANN